MSNIIKFPVNKRTLQLKIEKAIDTALANVKPEHKKSLKQEAFSAFKENENMFSNFNIDIPNTASQEQISNLEAIFKKETENKLTLVAQIMKLKIINHINKIEKEKI